MREGLVGGEGFAADASLIKADANRQRGVRGAAGLPPEAPSRAITEYLAVLDDAAFGGATPVVPKFISPADPASRWTGADKGPAYFAHSTNYLIDLNHAVIVDVEATTAVRQAEGHRRRSLQPQAPSSDRLFQHNRLLGDLRKVCSREGSIVATVADTRGRPSPPPAKVNTNRHTTGHAGQAPRTDNALLCATDDASRSSLGKVHR